MTNPTCERCGLADETVSYNRRSIPLHERPSDCIRALRKALEDALAVLTARLR